MKSLAELCAHLPGAVIHGDGNVSITNVEYDSRQIRPGSLFIAVPGFRQDGLEYAADAISRGAVAILGASLKPPAAAANIAYVASPDPRAALAEIAAQFYDYPGEKLKVCGVTGTNGKTTTSFFIREILRARGKTVGLVSTLRYDTGEEVFAAERTTPESLDLQRLFFLMVKNRCTNAVIETSSHALSLHRVEHVNFRVAVFTNFTRDHLDFHGTMAAYFDAKASLVDRLSGEQSYAVLNLDEPAWQPLFARLNCSSVTYALDNPVADIRTARYELLPDRTLFDLITPLGQATVSLRLPGRFNLLNALAAAAGGLASGADLDSVVRGLEAMHPLAGRLQPIRSGQPFAVYVDYAHTPDAIASLVATTRELTTGRIHLLFGCGGDRDRGKRPLMGEAACRNADSVVVTSDNPRTEEPLAIINDIRPGLGHNVAAIIPDRREAIAAILRHAQPGDAVLLAGKGAEPYQEIHGVKHPFSDEREAELALGDLGYHPIANGKSA